MRTSAIESLNELLSRPEGSWSLAEGAVVIARMRRPDLETSQVVARLDELGERARATVGDAWHPRFVAAGIARVLFREEGLRPAVIGSETPECVFIGDVLESGVGTPTLLALLFIEVARRTGFRFEAIALPGMSLLRHDHASGVYLFDPARSAQPLTVDDVKAAVAENSGGKSEFREGWLRPVSREQLLARLLTSLKALYWRGGEYDSALLTIRMLLTIRPDDPREIRDSGRLLFLLSRYRDAIEAFESYLSHNPHGEDADAVRMLLLEARAGLIS